MDINNRRYIGGKTKMLDHIYQAVIDKYGTHKGVFADIFAGTGVVAANFAYKGYPVILNDNLYSNYVVYVAWFKSENIDHQKVNSFMLEMNTVKGENLLDNYFSTVYGNKYFHFNDAKKIGYIRDCLENDKNKFNEREYCYILTSLLYRTDKIANTVGHFESFLNKQPIEKDIILEHLNVLDNVSAKFYNEDTNQLVRKIKADIVYIDPPYNARQYVNFYHVLENLARWEKPTEFEGNSMKFKRNHLKSGYCRSVAPKLFEDLICNIDAKCIIVSYNNTYSAKSISSNNTISEDYIIEVLSQKGKFDIFEFDYKFFNTGKTDLNNHKEKLYTCVVK